ncbi:MAG: DUF3343 domain-containing protein [bacterium]
MAVYAIITFHTTHFALKAKRVLDKSGRKPEMIPVPREFSSNCGFCCKVPWPEREEIEKILTDSQVEIDQIFRWERDDEAEKKKKFKFI